MTYRVELWIEGVSDPDRMPDVNVSVRARSMERALRAALLKAERNAGTELTIEDANVYREDR